MRVIILAAGMGNRLKEITRGKAKALAKIKNNPLILHVIDFARLLDPDEIVVVGGYQSKMLWEILKGEEIIPVDNTDYEMGNFYSLYRARSYLKDGFIQLNTDHIFPHRIASRLKNMTDGTYLVSDFDRRLFSDDMKITIDDQVDKGPVVTSISKALKNFDGGYCGITIVSKNGADDYISAMDKVYSKKNKQAVVEDVISELIHSGTMPGILDISGARWLEIDTPEDMANAQRILRLNPDFLK